MSLQGGENYYLRLAYRNDSGRYSDMVVNSIKIYGLTEYNFIENQNGKYESTNNGKNSTVCNGFQKLCTAHAESVYEYRSQRNQDQQGEHRNGDAHCQSEAGYDSFTVRKFHQRRLRHRRIYHMLHPSRRSHRSCKG